MLKAEDKISDAIIENMLSWRHSGFNVYCGPTIWPGNDKGLEDLARYIFRACFSQQRMTYIAAADALDGQAKVIYRSKGRAHIQNLRGPGLAGPTGHPHSQQG